MTYYYVATVDGDVFTSSSKLEIVIRELDRFAQMYPSHFRRNKVQILCYKASGEIIEWKPKNN